MNFRLTNNILAAQLRSDRYGQGSCWLFRFAWATSDAKRECGWVDQSGTFSIQPFFCYHTTFLQSRRRGRVSLIPTKSLTVPDNRLTELHERKLRAISYNMTGPNYPGNCLIHSVYEWRVFQFSIRRVKWVWNMHFLVKIQQRVFSLSLSSE